jgi:hypothetical protein
VPTGGAALSHEHAVAVVEPNLQIHHPRVILDVELGEHALLLDLERASHDLHLVQFGAVHLPSVVRVVLHCALELHLGQRDKLLTVLTLLVGCLKGGRIRAAQKVIYKCVLYNGPKRSFSDNGVQASPIDTPGPCSLPTPAGPTPRLL